jgi:hypothetical protein
MERMDNIGIVVQNLDAAIALFTIRPEGILIGLAQELGQQAAAGRQ